MIGLPGRRVGDVERFERGKAALLNGAEIERVAGGRVAGQRAGTTCPDDGRGGEVVDLDSERDLDRAEIGEAKAVDVIGTRGVIGTAWADRDIAAAVRLHVQGHIAGLQSGRGGIDDEAKGGGVRGITRIDRYVVGEAVRRGARGDGRAALDDRHDRRAGVDDGGIERFGETIGRARVDDRQGLGRGAAGVEVLRRRRGRGVGCQAEGGAGDADGVGPQRRDAIAVAGAAVRLRPVGTQRDADGAVIEASREPADFQRDAETVVARREFGDRAGSDRGAGGEEDGGVEVFGGVRGVVVDVGAVVGRDAADMRVAQVLEAYFALVISQAVGTGQDGAARRCDDDGIAVLDRRLEVRVRRGAEGVSRGNLCAVAVFIVGDIERARVGERRPIDRDAVIELERIAERETADGPGDIRGIVEDQRPHAIEVDVRGERVTGLQRRARVDRRGAGAGDALREVEVRTARFDRAAVVRHRRVDHRVADQRAGGVERDAARADGGVVRPVVRLPRRTGDEQFTVDREIIVEVSAEPFLQRQRPTLCDVGQRVKEVGGAVTAGVDNLQRGRRRVCAVEIDAVQDHIGRERLDGVAGAEIWIVEFDSTS